MSENENDSDESGDAIRLSEYDASQPLDLSEDVLSAIDAEINRTRTRLEYEFSADGRVRLRTSSYVGLVSLPDGVRVRIRPKAAGRNTLRLLRHAREGPLETIETTVNAERGEVFVDAIGTLFLDRVRSLLHRGIGKEYRRTESREPYLRGRLDVQRQLSRGSPVATRFDVEYSDLTRDTVANQAVLYAMHLLVRLVRSRSLQQSLRQYEQLFRKDVTLRPVRVDEIERLHLDRLQTHYADVLELAELVIRSVFVDDFRPGSRGTYGVLVNMNRVFESSVERAARDVVADTDWSVETQSRLRRLVTDGTPTIDMYPDFLLRGPNGRVRLVGDAKWKTGRVSQSDVYQLTSYQLADGVPGLLVYPAQDGAVETEYEVDGRHALRLSELPTDADVSSVEAFARELETALRAEFDDLTALESAPGS